MRTLIASLLAAGVLVGTSVAHAAPIALHHQLHRETSTSAITPIWQRCGHGFHRGNTAWVDKGGGWHGPCVPNRPKTASPTPSGGAADQLNRQELSRLQGEAPPKTQ